MFSRPSLAFFKPSLSTFVVLLALVGLGILTRGLDGTCHNDLRTIERTATVLRLDTRSTFEACAAINAKPVDGPEYIETARTACHNVFVKNTCN